MRPYGQKPGDFDTGEGKPQAGDRVSKPGGSYDMSQTEAKRIVRRVKKRERREAKETIVKEGGE